MRPGAELRQRGVERIAAIVDVGDDQHPLRIDGPHVWLVEHGEPLGGRGLRHNRAQVRVAGQDQCVGAQRVERWTFRGALGGR